MTTSCCTNCGHTKPHEEFHKSTKYNSGIQLWCKSCANAHGAYRMRKKLATKAGIEFNLTFNEYYVLRSSTIACPITGIPFREQGSGNGTDSATLDRIDPKKGYTIGNVAFISRRANSIKNDLTSIDEAKTIFKRIINYMEHHA